LDSLVKKMKEYNESIESKDKIKNIRLLDEALVIRNGSDLKKFGCYNSGNFLDEMTASTSEIFEHTSNLKKKKDEIVHGSLERKCDAYKRPQYYNYWEDAMEKPDEKSNGVKLVTEDGKEHVMISPDDDTEKFYVDEGNVVDLPKITKKEKGEDTLISTVYDMKDMLNNIDKTFEFPPGYLQYDNGKSRLMSTRKKRKKTVEYDDSIGHSVQPQGAGNKMKKRKNSGAHMGRIPNNQEMKGFKKSLTSISLRQPVSDEKRRRTNMEKSLSEKEKAKKRAQRRTEKIVMDQEEGQKLHYYQRLSTAK